MRSLPFAPWVVDHLGDPTYLEGILQVHLGTNTLRIGGAAKGNGNWDYWDDGRKNGNYYNGRSLMIKTSEILQRLTHEVPDETFPSKRRSGLSLEALAQQGP